MCDDDDNVLFNLPFDLLPVFPAWAVLLAKCVNMLGYSSGCDTHLTHLYLSMIQFLSLDVIYSIGCNLIPP